MTTRPTLLYVLAPSFSGSTLLTYLLAQHPEIATVGELKATQMGPPEQYFCSCGEPILKCDFWLAVKRDADAAGLRFSLDRFDTVFHGKGHIADKVVRATVRGESFERIRSLALHAIPGAMDQLDAIAARNRDLADILCNLQGGSIFLDGSKDAVRLLHLIGSGYWDIKVIYLQRDGRGVSSSIKSHGAVAYSEALRIWEHWVTELQSMRKRLDPDRTFELRYEDLCNEPADCMRRLWSWLNIEQLEIRETQFKSGEHHILGNAMRLSTMSEICFDEKWKTILSDDELRLFETRVGVLNRTLGYA